MMVLAFWVPAIVVDEGVLHDGVRPSFEIRVISKFVAVSQRFEKEVSCTRSLASSRLEVTYLHSTADFQQTKELCGKIQSVSCLISWEKV
jgi:hypothetical protein